jgi:predicted ferric reductase
MTGLLARGIAWVGLYLAVVLLPLFLTLIARLQDGVSITMLAGLAIATGIIAYSIMVSEFALVSRVKSVSRAFGTDALMYFHRLMGCIALAFLTAHTLLLVSTDVPASALNPMSGTSPTRLGAVALWLAILLVMTSLWRRRLRWRYEWWQATHSVLALVLVVACLGHVWLSVASRAGYFLAGLLSIYAAILFALLLYYRLLRPLILQRRPWELVENRDAGGSTRTLVLRPAGHAGLNFLPGQFAWLSTGRSAFGFGQHPISFSGSARAASRMIEFSIKALGDWSAREAPQLSPGARVFVDGPYGSFSPDQVPAQYFVLIAGGIGVAPMRSMLLTLRDRGDPRAVLLIHAAHDPSRAVFREEIGSLSSVMNLKVVPVYEVPPVDWPGERGYVTGELLRRHLPADLALAHFFLCGPPPMLDAVEQALQELRVPPGNVHAERFDFV